MRILHVIHSVDPRSGGPSHAIREIVRTQADAGHDVTLLTTTTQSAEPWARTSEYVARMQEDRAFDGVNLEFVRSYGRIRPFSRYAYAPGCSRRLNRLLADRRAVVHIHGVFSHLVTSAAKVCRSLQVPYILRPAGALDVVCVDRGRRGLKKLFISTFLRRDLAGAALVQAMSTDEETQLRRYVNEDRVERVPHGVHPVSSLGDSRTDFFEQHSVLRDRTIVLFLARLHSIKRPELLVRAIAALRSTHPNLALVVAGNDAGHEAEVRRTVAECGLESDVVFTGFLTGDDKRAAFDAARLFALPSAHENFGVSVVEAMAHAVPVLVTPEVAAHEHVDASGGGVTVTGDVESLAAGMKELLSSSRSEVGMRGWNYVREHLSWTAIGRRLEEMYESAMNSGVPVRAG